MSDLDLVRAEIKSWERDFASKHGRDPSVQDIKDQPTVADKYKLYKKLSRSLPKARKPDPAPPLPGFNPFSPTKKSRQTSRSSPHPNPFATPTKSIPKARPHISPDPPHPSTSADALPVPTTAVSRARKRLRGEPVSPSPSKPKRQRIRSHVLPTFPKLEQDSSNSGSDQELPLCDFSPSFVADSPVKAPAGGKSFKLLFDDALPALPIPKKPVGSSVAQSSSLSDATFSRTSADLASKSAISDRVHRATHTGSSIFPTKDHLSKRSSSAVLSESQPRTSAKRARDSNGPTHESTEPSASLQSKYPLVPPSPPPQDSISRDTSKGKRKMAATHKKLRVEGRESDEGADSPDDATLRVATVGLNRHKRFHRHAEGLDWDPLLHYGTRNHDSDAMQQNDANHHVSGTFNVDLPEKFRRVLAISPSQSQNRTEERVVRGLLYGDRVGHYDSSRGGIIWDAGEADDPAYGDVETEDDWEGEPVPWEAGEL